MLSGIAALPFATLATLRHMLYDKNILPVHNYSFPVINTGNLQLGGTGKTPMTEYLASLLLEKGYSVAILSRGYKRRSRGFVEADSHADPSRLGDEPYQMWQKFRTYDRFRLAVCGNRHKGIQILRNRYRPDVILLDDAFQHRAIQAGLNLLLTPFHRPFHRDRFFPAGRLRDLKSRAEAAQMIIVTKSPAEYHPEKEKLRRELSAYGPEIYFSSLEYRLPTNDEGTINWDTLARNKVLVITGIADPGPFYAYLTKKNFKFVSLNFNDHARYGKKSLKKINGLIKKEKIQMILTTEKDYYKLKDKLQMPVYYLPVRPVLENAKIFNKKIIHYVDTGKFI